MADAMISLNCASAEKIAQDLNNYLRENGYNTWICVEMRAGVAFREEIVVNASGCKAFIALMNVKWAESKECRYEFNIATRAALTKGMPHLIPVVLEQFDWNKYPLLIGLMANTNAIFFDPKNPTSSWEKVVASLKDYQVGGSGKNDVTPAAVVAATAATPAQEDLPKDIASWTMKHVAQWIESIDFRPPKEPFLQNWVNGETLLAITEQDLVESLKFTPLQARRIMKEVKKLTQTSVSVVTSVATGNQVQQTVIQHSQQGFRTGVWKGWYEYEQDGEKKRDDTSMDTTMVQGVIAGYGTDLVGDFLISGLYNDQKSACQWDKTYVGAHTIVYTGNIKKGVIQGKWHSKDYPEFTGPFELQFSS